MKEIKLKVNSVIKYLIQKCESGLGKARIKHNNNKNQLENLLFWAFLLLSFYVIKKEG